VLEVLYRLGKLGGARISPAAGMAKNVEFFLSVCLFVTLLNVRDCAPDFVNFVKPRKGYAPAGRLYSTF